MVYPQNHRKAWVLSALAGRGNATFRMQQDKRKNKNLQYFPKMIYYAHKLSSNNNVIKAVK